jgi:hypothetical protein
MVRILVFIVSQAARGLSPCASIRYGHGTRSALVLSILSQSRHQNVREAAVLALKCQIRWADQQFLA